MKRLLTLTIAMLLLLDVRGKMGRANHTGTVGPFDVENSA